MNSTDCIIDIKNNTDKIDWSRLASPLGILKEIEILRSSNEILRSNNENKEKELKKLKYIIKEQEDIIKQLYTKIDKDNNKSLISILTDKFNII